MTTPFIPKDYNQIFESLRIQVTGGKSQQFYYLPDHNYALPGQKIIAIHGIREGKSSNFKEEDYSLEKNTLSWKKNRNPDPGTSFIVYYYEDNAPPVTDMNVGSVARTICEAFAFELSFLQQNLQKFHEAMYIETAQGTYLERLARLFQIERIGAGKIYLTTEVIFHRQDTSGEINIKAGTLLQTENNEMFVTMYDVKILPGAKKSNFVLARSKEGFEKQEDARKKEEEIKEKKDIIKRLPMPVHGIEKVEQSTSVPISIKESIIESDDSLRERCKQALSSMGKCTVQAIEYELMSKGLQEAIVYTPDNPPPKSQINPGNILVVAWSSDKDKRKEIEKHLHNIKAAGIIAQLIWAKEIPYRLTITPILAPRYSYCDIKELKEKEDYIHARIEQELEAYFRRLRLGRTPRLEKLKSLLINCDPAILDCKIEGIDEKQVLRYDERATFTFEKDKTIQKYSKVTICIVLSEKQIRIDDKQVHDKSIILNDFHRKKESFLKEWFETQWIPKKESKTWESLLDSLKNFSNIKIDATWSIEKDQSSYREPFHITLKDSLSGSRQ